MYGFVNFVKRHYQRNNYQSHMDRCKVYKDQLKSNSIDEDFKQQSKHDIFNEVKMFLND